MRAFPGGVRTAYATSGAVSHGMPPLGRRRKPVVDNRVMAIQRAPDSPVTVRAVCLGLLCAVLVNLVMLYNDYYLRNTLMMGNHFPTVSMGILLVLILGVNALLPGRHGRLRLGQGELLLIWSMIGVAGGIGASGLMRYLPGWLVGPAYYATNSNEYETYILPHLPSWMVVTTDVKSHAARWFFEGLPKGEHIPWGEWMVPLTAWFVFALLLYGVMFAFTSVFFRHWAEKERLIFPIVYLPLEMTSEPAPGRRLNGFFTNPVMWAGAAIPAVILGLNGLRSYFPGLPAVPLGWDTYGWFPDRPWSEFNLDEAHVYFSIIGLTFLLTTEVSLSFWLFFVLYKLSYVFLAWLGSGSGGGFFGDWWRQVSVYEAAGAVMAIAAFLFWSARDSLKGFLAQALSGIGKAGHAPQTVAPGADDVTAGLLSARLSLILIVFGTAGMAGWMIMAGVAWWAALAGILVFLCVLLVLTRVVVEAGLLFIVSDVAAYDVLKGLVPFSCLDSRTMVGLTMQKGVMMHTLREILMPYLMNGVRALTLVRVRARQVLGVFALTVVVAMGIAALGRISTCYKYGGVNGDDFANLQMQLSYFGNLVADQKVPHPYDFVTAGGVRLIPAAVAHFGIGAVLAALLLFLRFRFLWWPLTPLGFIMCGTWGIAAVWFSIFLGWLAKWCVMTFGGAPLYRQILPLFLGLILGESFIATVWMVVSLITGLPGIYVLPP